MIGATAPFVMRRFLLPLLLVFSTNSYSASASTIIKTFTPLQVSKSYDNVGIVELTYSPVDVNRLYDITAIIKGDKLSNLIDKENKIRKCIDEYVKKQSKSYAKIAQDNLYDLLHNLEKITSKIYGRKFKEEESVPREQKLEALGEIQCEAYYTIGVIK